VRDPVLCYGWGILPSRASHLLPLVGLLLLRCSLNLLANGIIVLGEFTAAILFMVPDTRVRGCCPVAAAALAAVNSTLDGGQQPTPALAFAPRSSS